MIKPSDLSSRLLKWFSQERRDLPWRRHYKPYEVWLSEIMLQQTQMDTVLPYYERFLKKFPDLLSLANARQDEVLKAWEGLGYYSRARNLHKSAQIIRDQHHGYFPDKLDDIHALKGVGRYTAGAIFSIAYNKVAPIVDGNVLRVLARVYAIQKPIDDLSHREDFWRLQESLIPQDDPRNFNQAMMELGALVCKKESPVCTQCPLQGICKAYKAQQTHLLPIKENKKRIVKVTAACAIIRYQDQILICKKPEGAVMGGLWQLPEWQLGQNKSLNPTFIKKLTLKHIEKELRLTSDSVRLLGVIKRNYTHHLESLSVYELDADRKLIFKKNHWPARWIQKKDVKQFTFSSAYVKALKLIGW